jgi:hypothetical protein
LLADRTEESPLHRLDRILYVAGANAGHGVREAAEVLRQESARTPLTLLLPAKPGNPSQGVAVYLWRQPRIRILTHSGWPHTEALLDGDPLRLKLSPYHTAADIRLPRADAGKVVWVYPYTEYRRDRFMKNNPEFFKMWSFSDPAHPSVEIYARENERGSTS